MTELALRRQVQLAVSRLGARLFRNNVGTGWVGKLVSKSPDGTVILANARPITFGLKTGSSDLIGWSEDGRFLAIELKTNRVPVTDEQWTFLDAVQSAGGLAGVARTVAEAEAICRPARTPTGRAPDTTTRTPRP